MICKISIKIFLQQLHDIDPLVTPSEMVDILFLSPKIMSPSWNNSGSKIFRRATKPRLGWKTIQNYAMLVITGLRLVKGRVLLRNLVKKEE